MTGTGARLWPCHVAMSRAFRESRGTPVDFSARNGLFDTVASFWGSPLQTVANHRIGSSTLTPPQQR